MKYTILILFAIIVFVFSTNAQKTIVGEYALTGVMETGSAFKLNSDSTFEFYFSYGALDRYGSGKWSINNGNIIFISKPVPGKDFKLVNTNAANGNLPVIKIEDKNSYLFNLIYCRIKSPQQQDTVLAFDNDGVLKLPYAADSIEILSELCPERVSSFALQSDPHTYIFNIEPWIVEVFFKGDTFRYNKDFLEGKFLLSGDDKDYRFVKQNE